MYATYSATVVNKAGFTFLCAVALCVRPFVNLRLGKISYSETDIVLNYHHIFINYICILTCFKLLLPLLNVSTDLKTKVPNIFLNANYC